ncbi:hypothetical protein EIL50_01980 [bacterium NHP-B]|nr:hypothetical protein EIL50_01980 [bacterium NHP-B]
MRFLSLFSALLLTHSALHAGLRVTTQGGGEADITLHNASGDGPCIVYATRPNTETGEREKLIFNVNSIVFNNGVLEIKIQEEDQPYTICAPGYLSFIFYHADGVDYLNSGEFATYNDPRANDTYMAHIPLAAKPCGRGKSTFWTLNGATFYERKQDVPEANSWVAQYFFPQTWVPPVINEHNISHKLHLGTNNTWHRFVKVGHPRELNFSAGHGDLRNAISFWGRNLNRARKNQPTLGPVQADIKSTWVNHHADLRPLFEGEDAP